MIYSTNDIDVVAERLLEKKIGILPTDTIYGLHCLALDDRLIEKVRLLKQHRRQAKQFITLIPSRETLSVFNLNYGDFEKTQMDILWPGPNTLVIDGESFRLPSYKFILEVLNKTGPLISTSANLHGLPHANNVATARQYFGDKVDFYVDAGELDNPPSSVYKIYSDRVEKLR